MSSETHTFARMLDATNPVLSAINALFDSQDARDARLNDQLRRELAGAEAPLRNQITGGCHG